MCPSAFSAFLCTKDGFFVAEFGEKKLYITVVFVADLALISTFAAALLFICKFLG